jgi:hypothetical protein
MTPPWLKGISRSKPSCTQAPVTSSFAMAPRSKSLRRCPWGTPQYTAIPTSLLLNTVHDSASPCQEALPNSFSSSGNEQNLSNCCTGAPGCQAPGKSSWRGSAQNLCSNTANQRSRHTQKGGLGECRCRAICRSGHS